MTNEKVIRILANIKRKFEESILEVDEYAIQAKSDNKKCVTVLNIAIEALEKQINNPLTLDEVKELKCGDLVWLKDFSKQAIYAIKINEACDGFIYFNTFNSISLCKEKSSHLNIQYQIYRNKPEEEQK